MNPTNNPFLKRCACLSLMLVMTALMSYGYDFVVDDLAYIKHADGKTVGVAPLSQTGYPGLLEANIPERVTYDGVEYTVTAIEDYAFSAQGPGSYLPLKKVVIPSTVTRIGEWAFSDLRYLTSVTMGENVEQIGEGAFNGCISLESIVFPDKLSIIAAMTCHDCTSLKSVTIGKNVQNIGSSAFMFCKNLENIYCHVMNPSAITIDTFIFDYDADFSACTLHVPSGTKELYMACEPWSQFENIVDDLEPDFDFQPWIHMAPNIRLFVGNTHQMNIFTNPADMVLSWSSSNEAIAIVDQTGLVTAVAPGVAVITAMGSETGVPSASCNVYVNNVDNTINDVNCDGKIDIADVNQVVNAMLGRTNYDIPTGNNNGNDTAPGQKK